MRSFLAALCLVSTSAMAADDPMATRIGNTTLVIQPSGAAVHMLYRADHSFVAKSARGQVVGQWTLANGSLCLQFKTPVAGIGDKECGPADSHAVGDVWLLGGRHLTLIQGEVLDDTPEVLAALAAASRVGNTVVAKDPDGTETRLYWRPDHTFSATRPGWKTDGTWRVQGASLFLHYNIARPNMGSDEEMKNATPRRVGETWGMADRQVTLVAGEQLRP
jgi:hypothetical protein